MPQLNSNEKRLLSVMGVAVFLIANGFGWFVVSGAMERIDGEKTRLNAKLQELDNAKTQSDVATEKREWITANLKAYPDEPFRETYLGDIVNGNLKTGLDVELKDAAPMSTITQGKFFIRSRYRAKVTGPWQDVKEFIYRLQKPSEFRIVPSLTMVPGKNDGIETEQRVEAGI